MRGCSAIYWWLEDLQVRLKEEGKEGIKATKSGRGTTAIGPTLGSFPTHVSPDSGEGASYVDFPLTKTLRHVSLVRALPSNLKGGAPTPSSLRS